MGAVTPDEISVSVVGDQLVDAAERDVLRDGVPGVYVYVYV